MLTELENVTDVRTKPYYFYIEICRNSRIEMNANI